MNKTILIAGGASVASLAVGAAGGYLIAKKRFNDSLGEIIQNETEGIKKHYSVMLMEAQSGKPSSPADIIRREETESPEEVEEELSPEDEKVVEKATNALTDYRGLSAKAAKQAGVVASNVFDQAANTKPKKARPPRDPVTGAFRKKTPREEQHEPPELIDAEDFLLNDPDHQQETLLYFVNDKTLVMEADPTEVVDIALAGEVNLTLFPTPGEDGASAIYVRNEGMTTDYEIKLMAESLTEYIGLGEEEDANAKYL